MASHVKLRPAQRSDIPTLAVVANAANAQSVLHKRMAPLQDQYPRDYYHWRLNIMRQRFATPNLRNIVAEDPPSGEILGMASWAIEGTETALYRQWTKESSLIDWLEGGLIWIEKTWSRYTADRSVDYKFLSSFMAQFQGRSSRPPCIHCHLLVVNPSAQSKGVGQTLVNWAKELAVQEDLPIFLEATLEATRFYEKNGFQRLGEDVCVATDGEVAISLPAFVWEGEQRQGRWLDRDENSNKAVERWMWKENLTNKET